MTRRRRNPGATLSPPMARFAPDVLKALEARGHYFSVKRDLDLYFGGAQGVMYRFDGKLLGMGDPRRDGVAQGY